MSQHHVGLHKIQLVFHFCLYMPCDTKCRTFFRMAHIYFATVNKNLETVIAGKFLPQIFNGTLRYH